MNVSLKTNTPELAGEICDEIRLFIAVKRIEYVEEKADDGYFICHEFDENEFSHKCSLYLDGDLVSTADDKEDKPDAHDVLLYKKMKKRGAKKTTFYCMKGFFKKDLPWGNLTGIRPTKLFREMKDELGEDAAISKLRGEFCVSEEKLKLLRQINAVQQPFIDSVSDDVVDIYIGIPFCTTKCAYCSFSSGLTSKDGAREREYVDALLREIDMLSEVTSRCHIRSVYIGGGTPTSLNEAQLERVLFAAGKMADGCAEFTVEAGRPDTITKEKLALIKAAGAGRISVNAQTANDETLKRMGRSHSFEQFASAYELAKSYGFLINTDLILGLPGESTQDALYSVKQMMRLEPQNITVHTLAIKNASRFAEENERGFMDADDAIRGVEQARELLATGGYLPYYMYRQKYMAGNLENVGYSKKGCEGVYNIDIMEETTSIIAFGAGGMSKRVYDKGRRIERTPAVKDIHHYLTRTDEMAERKLELFKDIN